MSDLVEYKPGTTFPGVIGRTVSESSLAWPEPTRAKEGLPDVLFFVLDDVGYGQMSAFGGFPLPVCYGRCHGRAPIFALTGYR
jgi:hypothetical protein